MLGVQLVEELVAEPGKVVLLGEGVPLLTVIAEDLAVKDYQEKDNRYCQ
jgi:hypothetical protein